jgi:hypothetical protein
MHRTASVRGWLNLTPSNAAPRHPLAPPTSVTTRPNPSDSCSCIPMLTRTASQRITVSQLWPRISPAVSQSNRGQESRGKHSQCSHTALTNITTPACHKTVTLNRAPRVVMQDDHHAAQQPPSDETRNAIHETQCTALAPQPSVIREEEASHRMANNCGSVPERAGEGKSRSCRRSN